MKAIPKMGHSDLAIAFHTVLGSGARKQLARDACVSPETAKRWLAGNWPVARQAQLTALLRSHVERRKRDLIEIERRIADA